MPTHKSITIYVDENIPDKEYALIANAAWFLVQASAHGQSVEARDVPARVLNKSWAWYADQNPWPS